jgi:hypothetical protein
VPNVAIAKRPSFKKLWDAYPTGSVEEVKALIGGAVNADWIANTAAVRLSRALLKAGETINPALLPPIPRPDGRREVIAVKGADQQLHIFRVAVMKKWLELKYGAPTSVKGRVVQGRGRAIDVAVDSFVGKRGIIYFEVPMADATGHVDLWDGTTKQVRGGNPIFDKASEVFLWELPD